MNAIYLRSSVRQYTDESVDIRDIEKLMRACSRFPRRKWQFRFFMRRLRNGIWRSLR